MSGALRIDGLQDGEGSIILIDGGGRDVHFSCQPGLIFNLVLVHRRHGMPSRIGYGKDMFGRLLDPLDKIRKMNEP